MSHGASRLGRFLARAVEQQLLSQQAALGDTRGRLDGLATRLDTLEGRWSPLREQLDAALAGVTFTPRTTVGRALSLHPGVTALLAEHGLDRCEGCPVRHDESLEELATGHDIPLEQLLSRLDALLAQPAEG